MDAYPLAPPFTGLPTDIAAEVALRVSFSCIKDLRATSKSCKVYADRSLFKRAVFVPPRWTVHRPSPIWNVVEHFLKEYGDKVVSVELRDEMEPMQIATLLDHLVSIEELFKLTRTAALAGFSTRLPQLKSVIFQEYDDSETASSAHLLDPYRTQLHTIQRVKFSSWCDLASASKPALRPSCLTISSAPLADLAPFASSLVELEIENRVEADITVFLSVAPLLKSLRIRPSPSAQTTKEAPEMIHVCHSGLEVLEWSSRSKSLVFVLPQLQTLDLCHANQFEGELGWFDVSGCSKLSSLTIKVAEVDCTRSFANFSETLSSLQLILLGFVGDKVGIRHNNLNSFQLNAPVFEQHKFHLELFTPNLKSLTLETWEQGWRLFFEVKALEYLNVPQNAMKGLIFALKKSERSFLSLRRLTVLRGSITVDSIAFFGGLRALTWDLSQNKLALEDLSSLAAKCSLIEELTLTGTDRDSASPFFASLSRWSHLKRAELVIDDRFMSYKQAKCDIISLNLVELVCGTTSPDHLKIWFTRIQAPALLKLELRKCRFEQSTALVQLLQSLPQLQHLILDAKIDDKSTSIEIARENKLKYVAIRCVGLRFSIISLPHVDHLELADISTEKFPKRKELFQVPRFIHRLAISAHELPADLADMLLHKFPDGRFFTDNNVEFRSGSRSFTGGKSHQFIVGHLPFMSSFQ